MRIGLAASIETEDISLFGIKAPIIKLKGGIFHHLCDRLAKYHHPIIATTLEESLLLFRTPSTITLRPGSQFEGDLMNGLCDLLGVKKKRTLLYHPQGNRVVERDYRTPGDAPRTLLLTKSQEDWHYLLPHVMRTFRTIPHSTTAEN